MGTTTVILPVFCLPVVIVDSCSISSIDCCNIINGSCCSMKYDKFKFSTIYTSRSGVYNISNFCGHCNHAAEGYCDGTTAGGGWLVVQRRQDGSVDFNRTWVDYEDGFGSLTGEFWYGLRPLHCLTNQGQWEMCIDFTLTNGTKSYLSYSSFKVGPASSNYQLSISGYSGIVSKDLFSSHPLNGMPFTTKDKDNDKSNVNCAVTHGGGDAGGWWYNSCTLMFTNNQHNSSFGVYLGHKWNMLSFTEMKVRPINCAI